jgi:hypothetical protein
MKKIAFIALIALAFSLYSCSSSGSGSGSGSNSNTVTFKVAGVNKTFTNAVVEESAGSIYVTAHIGPVDNPTETVFFIIASNETGTDALYDFAYDNPTDNYYFGSATFNRNVSVNNSTTLQGTFSGSLNSSTSATLAISQGSFDLAK